MVHQTTEQGSIPIGHPSPETASPHWAVCRTYSNRVHRVGPEIEKTGHGTFLPTYARVFVRDGKISVKERVLMPGYLFFMTGDDWTDVKNIDGVFDVLANNGRAGRVTDAEMRRMVIDHMTGLHNERNLDGLDRQPGETKRQRARRPRASRRARIAA